MLEQMKADISIEFENLKLWIPVGFAAGCLLYFSFPVEPSIFNGIILCLLGLIGMIFIRKFYPTYLVSYHGWCLIFLLASGFCLAWIQTHQQEPLYRIPTHATFIQGTVQQVESLATGKKRLTVNHVCFLTFPESEQQEWHRKLRFTLLLSDQQLIKVGDQVKAKIMLNHPFPPARVGEYDLQFYAWFKNIGAYGYALAPIERIKISHKLAVQVLRESMANHIERVLPNTSGAIAQILLTGIGTKLSIEDRHNFAVSGLAHLLAIAGLHLGTVMFISGGIIRWLLLRSEYIALYWPVKRIALLSGWGVGCIYFLLTGFHLPAMRSLTMASLVVVALLYNRLAFSMHNLMLAALLILVISPSSVLNVSFQMSMAAVMALIAGYRYGYNLFLRKYKAYSGYKKFMFYMAEASWVSLLAGLAVCPIVMAHFHELNLYFVFANLIAVPLTMFWILPMGLLSLLTMVLGLDHIFLHLMAYGIDIVVYIAKFVSHLPHAVIYIQHVPQWGLALYFLGLCLLCLGITRLRLIGIPIIILGVLSCLWVSVPDVVTSADGQMVGIRQAKTLWLVCQRNCNKIIVNAWQRYLGTETTKIMALTTHDPNIICHDFYCKIINKKLLVTFKPAAVQSIPPQLCHSVALEISLLWDKFYCPLQTGISKKSNWIAGSHSIWLKPLTIKTDLIYRGKRPWVKEPIDRGAPNLPMASSE